MIRDKIATPTRSDACAASAEETKEQMRSGPSLTRQTGALIAASLLSQASSVMLLMALTRLVPKAQLGAYQQLLLLYGIVSPLLVAGIPTALLYFVPRSKNPEDSRLWVGEAYALLGVLGFVCSVVVAVAHTPIADVLGNPSLSPVLLIYAPVPFFSFITAVMTPALVAARRTALAAKLGVLASVLTLITMLVAVTLGRDAKHMAAALVVSQACVALISTHAVRRAIGIALVRERLVRGGVSLLRYGLPLALTGLAGMFAFQFDRLVVSRDFSPALYAVYAVGAVELPLSVLVQQAVNSVLMPALTSRYAAGDMSELAALWRRAIRRTSLVLLPTFVFFMLTAPATVQLLFGAAYRDSTVVFRIYLFLVPLRVATYGLITQAIGRTRINLSASFVLLGANAVLVLALVGPLGLRGPAVATVVASYGMALYYLVRLRAILHLSIRTLFPWPLVLANLSLSAVAAIPVGLLMAVGLNGLIQLPVAAAVYIPCYVALLLVWRRLDAEEIDFGRRAVQRVFGSSRPDMRTRPSHGSA